MAFQLQGHKALQLQPLEGLNKLAAYNLAVFLQQETPEACMHIVGQLDIWQVSQKARGRIDLVPVSLIHLHDVPRLSAHGPAVII